MSALSIETECASARILNPRSTVELDIESDASGNLIPVGVRLTRHGADNELAIHGAHRGITSLTTSFLTLQRATSSVLSRSRPVLYARLSNDETSIEAEVSHILLVSKDSDMVTLARYLWLGSPYRRCSCKDKQQPYPE